MRVYEETIAPSGKKRVLFASGIEEIKILAGLVANAKLYTPRVEDHPELGIFINRLNDMGREFSKYLHPKDLKIKRPKTHKCPFCDRSCRGEKALAMHIDKVHTKG